MKITIFVAILMIIPISMAFADNSEVTIEPISGSASPGCDETAEGCYSPSTANVDFGGVVIMTNTDNAAHTFTSGTPSDGPSDIFDSALVMAGQSYQWSPDSEGEIPYFCMVHPWMTGLIIVGEGDSSDSTYVPFVPPTPVPSSDNNLKNENIRLQNKILFLEDEKENLIKSNFKLKSEIKILKNEMNFLESHIDELQSIINEQIKVILVTLLDMKK